MPLARSWTAPPTRREITLLLFSLTIFVLSYNLEASLAIVGVHPQKLTSSYLSSLGEFRNCMHSNVRGCAGCEENMAVHGRNHPGKRWVGPGGRRQCMTRRCVFRTVLKSAVCPPRYLHLWPHMNQYLPHTSSRS